MTNKRQSSYSFSVRTENKLQDQDLSALAKQWNAGVQVILTNPYHMTQGPVEVTHEDRKTDNIKTILPNISQPSKLVEIEE